MSELTHPLFEEEKAFLERKKLEYERALRGDVAQLKDQTANAGRFALVGAGLAGSVWLITKALGGGKRKKRRRDEDRHEQECYNDDEAYDYDNQYFGNADFADEEYDDDDERDYPEGDWQDPSANYFADDTDDFADDADDFDANYPAENHGSVYHSDSDSYDTPTTYTTEPEAYSSVAGADEPAAPVADQAHEPLASDAASHTTSLLPFDDSRRLPESNDFAAAPEEEDELDAKPGYDFSHLARPQAPQQSQKPGNTLGSMLVSLAKGPVGKAILGQAATFGVALATKALQNKLSGNAVETAKISDLAPVSWKNDGYAHGHPATPQPDVTSAPANDTAYFQDPA